MKNLSCPSTVWLLYGNGVPPEEAFAKPRSEEQNLGYLLKVALEQAGFNIGLTADGSDIYDVAAVISWDASEGVMKHLRKHPREKCFLFAFEPPTVSAEHYSEAAKACFGKIFVMLQDLVDQDTFVKFHFPLPPIQIKRAKNLPSFAEKKLCTMMNGKKFFRNYPGELYTLRWQIASFFNTKGEDFDLYGRGWNDFSCWKGALPHEGTTKVETLKKYKFTIAFENTMAAGHITDKLFPAMAGFSIPIYLGATDVINYVPKTCFIDFRDFSSFEDLYAFLKAMDQKTHESYLAAAQDFLNSDPRLQLFTAAHFMENVMKYLNETV